MINKSTTTTNENPVMNRTTDIEKVRELALKQVPDNSREGNFTNIRTLINAETYPLRIFQAFDGLYDPLCPYPRFYCNKLSLLMEMESVLSLADMRPVMRYVWTTCISETNNLSVADTKAILRMLRDCNLEGWGLMDNGKDYGIYQMLPEELTIYRMAPKDTRRRKFFSWTIDLKRALQSDFVSRFGINAGRVCKAKVKKKDVLAYFAENSEVIVNPGKVFDFYVEELGTVTYQQLSDALTALKNSYSEGAVEGIYTRNLGYSSEIKDVRAAIDATRNILQETCNVETAQLIGTYKIDLPSDSSLYYEENLYQQNTGEFFLVGEGNAMSKYNFIADWGYPQGCRRSIPITQAEANVWIASKLSPGLKGAGDESTVVDFQRGLAS